MTSAHMIEGLVDGQSVQLTKDSTALEAARSLGLAIPTLCHHEGLPPEGNCRVCLVEIGGRLVTSCMYPLRDNGFEILTNSPTVRAGRRFVLSMLVNRGPASPRLLALAAEYDVAPETRFAGPEPDDLCIRCSRCVRACEINETSAISLVGRGRDRQVAGPFFQPPEDCVGCLACAAVCPTGAIGHSEKDGRRSIWGREFELLTCHGCGRPLATAEEWARSGNGAESICQDCRRQALAADLKTALKYR